MDTIDDDAELVGIDPKVWKTFREMTPKNEEEEPKESTPLPKLVQGEFESITGPVDDHEAFVRRKEALARRAFAWYKLCKDKNKKLKLTDIYNKIALMKER